jgi:hypothetical protein
VSGAKYRCSLTEHEIKSASPSFAHRRRASRRAGASETMAHRRGTTAQSAVKHHAAERGTRHERPDGIAPQVMRHVPARMKQPGIGGADVVLSFSPSMKQNSQVLAGLRPGGRLGTTTVSAAVRMSRRHSQLCRMASIPRIGRGEILASDRAIRGPIKSAAIGFVTSEPDRGKTSERALTHTLSRLGGRTC